MVYDIVESGLEVVLAPLLRVIVNVPLVAGEGAVLRKTEVASCLGAFGGGEAVTGAVLGGATLGGFLACNTWLVGAVVVVVVVGLLAADLIWVVVP